MIVRLIFIVLFSRDNLLDPRLSANDFGDRTQRNPNNLRPSSDAKLFMSRTHKYLEFRASIKYMKSSGSESVKNGCLNLERLSRQVLPAWFSREFHLLTALIQTPNPSCAEPCA